MRVAEASHGEARVMQGYTVIRAPFSGVVTAKLANAGDQALPGRPLLILEDPTALRLEASVPEVMAARVRVGQKLAIVVDAVGEKLQGSVAEVSPSAEASTRTVMVKIDLPSHPALRTGMFGRVELSSGERRALEIPVSALVQRGQLEMVFVAQADHAALRLVSSGRTRSGFVEIASGLDVDERVVITNAASAQRRSAARGPPVTRPRLGPAGALARAFVDSKLTPLFIVASVLLGLFALVLLPREEEPQIKVPMVDVMVAMPGASAKEVESRVSAPIERLLWEIPGVEYVYTTSQPGRSLAVVRFRVGEDVERSVVKLDAKLSANHDRIPSGVSPPLVKVRSIDDVPILALTFHGKDHDHLTLRRLAAEVASELKRIPEVSETQLIGGLRRQVRVSLDPALLASRSLGMAEVARSLRQANEQKPAGIADDRRSKRGGADGWLLPECGGRRRGGGGRAARRAGLRARRGPRERRERGGLAVRAVWQRSGQVGCRQRIPRRHPLGGQAARTPTPSTWRPVCSRSSRT